MSFPPGTPTVTLVGRIPSAVAGTAYAGKLVCRPSAYLVDSGRNAVYPGGGSVAFASDGTFSVVLLPCDAPGIEPVGWRWFLDLQPIGGQRVQFYANVTGTGTVDYADLIPVPAPGGGTSSGSGVVSSVNGQTGAVVLAAADVDADPEGTASAAVAAHVAATDPHGDRAAASTALAIHASATTSVHGIADTAALETAAGATAKVSSHAAASDPHGDRAWAGGQFYPLASGNNLDTYVNDVLTRVAAIEGGSAFLAGLNVTNTARIINTDLKVEGSGGTVRHALNGAANTAGFFGAAPVAQPTVSGSRADGTALSSVLTALGSLGLITNSSSAGIAAPWRQRHLPDPVTADALYTGAAPSVSTAQTTTPTVGYIKYAPAGVALAGSDVTGPYAYAGAGSFAIGATSPDTNYVLPLSKYPNTYASGQGVWSVEFGTDAQLFQVRMKYISTATMYRLSIDGRKVTDLMQSSGGTTAGSGHLITFDLGSTGPRRIRLDFSTFPFGGVYLPPGATMWRVPLQGGRLMSFTDSIGDGSAQNTGAGCGTWVDRVGRFLGCTDVWRQGRGGTGYITAGSYATFGDRVNADAIAWNPTRLIILGGYNDNGGSQSAISTAATSLYSAIKSGLPSCEVYVIGCWSPTGSPAASIVNTDNTLKAAAATAGYPFISPVTGSVYDSTGALVATHGPWITGTGRVGATTGSGNADVYIGTDAVHPTDAGHVYLARRITAAIRELMPA